MTETPKDENEGTGGPSELSAGVGCDLRALLIACRGSVKTDLNAYERLLVAKQKHGEQETPTYTAADAEAQRLFALLAEIDALAGDYKGSRGNCPHCEIAALKEWQNDAAGALAQFVSLSAHPEEEAWGEVAIVATRLLNQPSNAKVS